MKSTRQKVLEDMLNDVVCSLCKSLYKWHDRYYEVLPYSLVLKRHNWSGFVRATWGKKTYMIREASNVVIAKHYPLVWAKLQIELSLKYNPKLITTIDK